MYPVAPYCPLKDYKELDLAQICHSQLLLRQNDLWKNKRL